MLKNALLLAGISAGALVAANAPTYHVTLMQDSVVDGHQLKPGDYDVKVDNNTATLKHGKQVIQVPAHEETAKTKFSDTAVEYTGNTVRKIDFGGKHTSIVFNNNASGNAGGSTGAAE